MANRQPDMTKGFYTVPPAWHFAVARACGVAPKQIQFVVLQQYFPRPALSQQDQAPECVSKASGMLGAAEMPDWDL